MDLIRQNLFYVVLVGVVAVAGSILIGMIVSVGGDVDDEQIPMRAEDSKALMRLNRPPLVNKKILANQRQFVETIRVRAQQVARECVEWNRRHYKDLIISAKDKEGGTETPAFPHRPAEYIRRSFEFSQAYLEQSEGLLAQLRPTRPPTNDEINAAAVPWLRMYERQTPTTKPAGSGVPEPGGEPKVAPNLQQRAIDQATLQMRVKKATDGLIYASIESVDRVFSVAMPNLRIELLYQGQVGLWVQSDVIGAITDTNNQVILAAGKDPAKAGVMDSAVKRLAGIKVKLDAYEAAGPAPRPALGAPRLSVRRPLAPEPVHRAIGNLTGRSSEARYEVIRYGFTVIMPARHVLRLLRNLERRNFHTVLKVSKTPVLRQAAEGYFYYGPEAVTQVMIEGELLLLTDWVRGRWDEEKGQWSQQYPPLMPVEVLRRLSAMGLEMRADDLRRLREVEG